MNTQKLPEVQLASSIERQLEEAKKEAYVRGGLSFLGIDVEAEAARHGISVAEYIRRAIKPTPTWGAQILAQLEADGVLGAWADREDIGDSSEYARKLRRQAETRVW